MDYRYHIRQFSWNKELNEFFSEAYFLECVMPDGGIHPEAFPNQKQQFYIDNPKTGGFRRFRFIKEENANVEIDGESWFYTYWMFESEDGIKCKILIN
jgi:hypothetical protein